MIRLPRGKATETMTWDMMGKAKAAEWVKRKLERFVLGLWSCLPPLVVKELGWHYSRWGRRKCGTISSLSFGLLGWGEEGERVVLQAACFYACWSVELGEKSNSSHCCVGLVARARLTEGERLGLPLVFLLVVGGEKAALRAATCLFACYASAGGRPSTAWCQQPRIINADGLSNHVAEAGRPTHMARHSLLAMF